MTYEEAIKAFENNTPVIYTGPGSMGRPSVWIVDNKRFNLRGSKESIGIITKLRRKTAVVDAHPGGFSGMNFEIKYLEIAIPEELHLAKSYNKKELSNLTFIY